MLDDSDCSLPILHLQWDREEVWGIGKQRREDVGWNGEKRKREGRGAEKIGAVKRIERIKVENERKLEKKKKKSIKETT